MKTCEYVTSPGLDYTNDDLPGHHILRSMVSLPPKHQHRTTVVNSTRQVGRPCCYYYLLLLAAAAATSTRLYAAFRIKKQAATKRNAEKILFIHLPDRLS